MQANIDLEGVRMRVAAVGSADGIDAETVFAFRQDGARVWAEYSGGNIAQGFLIGTLDAATLTFDYIQVTRGGRRDKGESSCTLGVSEGGLLQLTERFRWASRDGAGVNVMEQIRG
jgi:hypothetical protein